MSPSINHPICHPVRQAKHPVHHSKLNQSSTVKYNSTLYASSCKVGRWSCSRKKSSTSRCRAPRRGCFRRDRFRRQRSLGSMRRMLPGEKSASRRIGCKSTLGKTYAVTGALLEGTRGAGGGHDGGGEGQDGDHDGGEELHFRFGGCLAAGSFD
jgi:hypothetical protein